MKTEQTARKNYPLIDRGDGRIELMCSHGVGHPSEMISKRLHPTLWDDKHSGIHGCDGCCSSAAFYVAENVWYIEINTAAKAKAK